MNFNTQPMDPTTAAEIAGWKYEQPYDFYDMGGPEESDCELLNGSYWVVVSRDGEVIGFYCIGESAQVPAGQKCGAYQAYQGGDDDVMDLGIGVRPDLTGRGLGSRFLARVLREVTEHHPTATIRLTVATFNQRAIKLYQRFGFRVGTEFEQNGTTFQTMTRLASHIVWLRRTNSEDELWLREWLCDPDDCAWTIGHTPFRKEDFASWFDAPDQELWVLDSESGPVGYGEVWVDEESGDVELAHLVVAPEQRGRGLGRTLVDLLCERAGDAGFPFVYMRVTPNNEQALACYGAVGFREMTEIPDGWPKEYVWLRRA